MVILVCEIYWAQTRRTSPSNQPRLPLLRVRFGIDSTSIGGRGGFEGVVGPVPNPRILWVRQGQKILGHFEVFLYQIPKKT